MTEARNRERLEQELEEIVRAIFFGFGWILFLLPCLLWAIHLARKPGGSIINPRTAYLGAAAMAVVALMGGLPFLLMPNAFSYLLPVADGVSGPAGYPCVWLTANFGLGGLFYLFLPHWQRLQGRNTHLREDLF